MSDTLEPCKFCHEVPDFDNIVYADAARTRCTKRGCMVAWAREYDQMLWNEKQRVRALRAAGKGSTQRRGRRRKMRYGRAA